MNTLYKLIITCFIACVALSAAAQSDYRPGYMIMSHGDTLLGLVSYRSSTIGSNTCGFKKNEQSSSITYTPNDIAGYGFPNDKNYKTLVLDHADTLAAEYVFMEELVRGPINLYNYKGTFFVEKQDSKLQKLYITNEEYVNRYGAPAKRQINHHIQVLNTLMQDCFSMFSKIERVKLAEKSMVELVREYNQCAGGDDQTIFKELKPWIAVRPGFLGGISSTSLNFSAKDERYLHLEHASFSTSNSATFGASLLMNSPRLAEHVSLLLEGRYLAHRFEATPSYTWFDTYYSNEVAIDLSAIKLAAALRYDFAGKRIQPFINAGGFMNIFQKPDYKHRQYVKWTRTSEPIERIKDDPEFVSKNQKGVMAGAGTYLKVKKAKLSLEGRYELGMNLHSQNVINALSNSLSSKTNTVSILFGLHF